MNAKLFKLLKNKIAVAIALLSFIIMGAGTIMAMKAPDKAKMPTAKKQVNTTWYYNGGTGDAAILTASNWSTSTMPSDCQDDGTRPCSISVNASDQSSLQSFLNTKTASQVTALSPEKRP